MKDSLVPIDQAGRIVLPKNVRQELAIKAGDVFKISIHGSAVTLTPSRESAGFVRKGRALVFATSGDETLTQGTINAQLEADREERGSPGRARNFRTEAVIMTLFLDTSVLVAAVLANHESHLRSFAVLNRIQNGKDEGILSAHSLAEMYAILTKLPVPFRHTPEQALLSIEENVINHFKISSLTGADYSGLIREAALSGIQGGTIYDAILLKCAAKSAVDRIYTLNLKHFQAVAPRNLMALLSLP